MSHRYICRLDNPLIIKASGYVGAGGLGAFDPSIYEEVEGPLPKDAQDETQPKSFDVLMDEFFAKQDPAIQIAFASDYAAVITLLKVGKIELAKGLILKKEIPSELNAEAKILEEFRSALLALMPN